MIKLKNEIIPNIYAEYEGGPFARACVQVPRKYNTTPLVKWVSESGELVDKPSPEDIDKGRVRKHHVLDTVDCNTFRALRHIACAAMANEPIANGQNAERLNKLEDARQARTLIKCLGSKGVNKGDEEAPHVWIDDASKKWALRMIEERGVSLFAASAADVHDAIAEGEVKEDPERTKSGVAKDPQVAEPATK